MLNELIFGVIAIVVGVILITSQAVTIHDSTDTSTGKPLENVSASAKTMYGLYDFLWAVAGLGLIIGGLGLFFYTSYKKLK